MWTPTVPRYTLLNQVGEGGYSRVYKCVDAVGILHACKVMPKKTTPRDAALQEVGIMRTLSAKTLQTPRLVEAREDASSYYVVQELCSGGDAWDYLEQSPRASVSVREQAVARVVRGALQVLDLMHETGIVHGDVKPDNLLMSDASSSAYVKLADFGTSLWAPLDDFYALVDVPNLRGTPCFLAPEALQSKRGFASDIWAVGVMTYQLLSIGQLPFTDKTSPGSPSITKVFRSVLEDSVRFDDPTWLGVSNNAKAFIVACLAKAVSDRPTVKECLVHPWLRAQSGQVSRSCGVSLDDKELAYF